MKRLLNNKIIKNYNKELLIYDVRCYSFENLLCFEDPPRLNFPAFLDASAEVRVLAVVGGS